MHFLATSKGAENYIFLFDLGSIDALLTQIGRFAANKDLSFSWHDAAVLSKAIQRLKPT